MHRHRAALVCLIPTILAALPAAAAESAARPRPTPVTRPAMKRLLEDMKQREPRIPLPELTVEERAAAEADPMTHGYEGRLRSLHLPGTELRSYIFFGGSAPRRPGAPPPRVVVEPDPATTLDYGFKTRLFWIASRANNCQYCLGHQESKLLAVGMTDDDLAALDSDWSAFPEAEQAAFAFARGLTTAPWTVDDAMVERLRPFYTDLQILEMALSVGGNNAINRWKEGIGVPQSGNGGSSGFTQTGADGVHSYLTPTGERFRTVASVVAATTAPAISDDLVATVLDADLPRPDTATLLQLAATRRARLPLADDATVRRVLGERVPEGSIPGWMRLLAHYPVAGPRAVAALVAGEDAIGLPPLLRARLRYVVARQDGAAYALGEARTDLRDLGQSDAQIAALEADVADVPEADRTLLILARDLASSPVMLTDDTFAAALAANEPATLTRTIHYVALRALFDRFTEAAGLPLDR